MTGHECADQLPVKACSKGFNNALASCRSVAAGAATSASQVVMSGVLGALAFTLAAAAAVRAPSLTQPSQPWPKNKTGRRDQHTTFHLPSAHGVQPGIRAFAALGLSWTGTSPVTVVKCSVNLFILSAVVSGTFLRAHTVSLCDLVPPALKAFLRGPWCEGLCDVCLLRTGHERLMCVHYYPCCWLGSCQPGRLLPPRWAASSTTKTDRCSNGLHWAR